MKTEFKQKTKVLSSQTDFTTKVGVLEALRFFQDNMTEYYKNLNCDGVHLIESCHTFWAVTKTKIRFEKNLHWLESVSIKTDICKLTSARMNLCGEMFGQDPNIYCIQELCGVDSISRKLKLINDIPEWPKNIEPVKNYSDLKFDKMDFELEECFLKNVAIVQSVNVDFFGHTNNVEYARFMYATLSREFLKNICVEEFEIQYYKESKCGDELKIYNKISDCYVLFEIKLNDEIITRANLKFKNI